MMMNGSGGPSPFLIEGSDAPLDAAALASEQDGASGPIASVIGSVGSALRLCFYWMGASEEF